MGRKGRPRAQRHLHPGLFPGASEQQPSPNTTGCQLWGALRASAGLTSSLAGQLPASLLLNEDRRPVTINYNTQKLQLMHCLSRRKLHRGHLPAAKGHSRQWLQLLWQPRERGQACRWAEEPWQLPEVGTSSDVGRSPDLGFSASTLLTFRARYFFVGVVCAPSDV